MQMIKTVQNALDAAHDLGVEDDPALQALLWAGNLKSRYVVSDEGGRVLNDIRAQIDAEIIRHVRALQEGKETGK